MGQCGQCSEWLRTGQPSNWGSNPGRGRSAQTNFDAHKISSTLRTGDDTYGEKRPGREADKLTSSNANVKNECSYSFAGPYDLKACRGVKFT
jgi:hypothetical protein